MAKKKSYSKAEKDSYKSGVKAGYSKLAKKLGIYKPKKVERKLDKWQVYTAKVRNAYDKAVNEGINNGLSARDAKDQAYYLYKDDIRAAENRDGKKATAYFSMIPGYEPKDFK